MYPQKETKKHVEANLLELIMKRKNLGRILLCFGKFSRLSSYEISKLLGVKYGEVHKEMEELETLGLVEGREERVKNTFRIKKVYGLTEKGKAFLPLLKEETVRTTIKFFSSIGLEEELWRELTRFHMRGGNEERNPSED